MEQPRILIVEDDGVSRLMFELQLQKAGHIVVAVASGEEAISVLSLEHFDLLITDLRLSTMDGVEVLKAARKIDPQIEVIIVTGAACAHSAISALNRHAHSYLLKPVHNHDLISSVSEALAKRHRIAERAPTYSSGHAERSQSRVLRIGPLRIDPYRHHVTYSDQALLLSSSEFSLLMYLAHRRGAVVSAQEIATEVLRRTCTPQEARDVAKGHIHRLRQKIELPPHTPRLIHSVRGAGYRLADDDEIGAR